MKGSLLACAGLLALLGCARGGGQAFVAAEVPDARNPTGSRVVLVEAGRMRVLSAGMAEARSPAVSPDGKSALFAGKKTPSSRWAIYELRLAGWPRGPRAVAEMEADCGGPAYLSGGRVVCSCGGDLYAGPPGNLRRITFGPYQALDPAPLQDGRLIFTWTAGPGRARLFTINADGTWPEAFTHPPSRPAVPRRARQTRDGGVVYLSRDASGAPRLERMELRRPAAPPRTLDSGLAEVRAAEPLPDGALLLAGRSSGSEGVFRWREGVPPERVFSEPGYAVSEAVPAVPSGPLRGRPLIADPDQDHGTLLCYDADQSDGLIGPRRGGPKAAVVELLVREDGRERLLKSAAVESDGSFLIDVPADRPVKVRTRGPRAQAIAASDWFWLRPGEVRSCIGCHEGHVRMARNRLLKALAPRDGAAAAAAPAGGGSPDWYQRHLDGATGRPGTKRVSCPHCHRRETAPPSRDSGPRPGPRYLDPEGLAVSPDGESLFVAAQNAGLLLKVRLGSGQVVASAPVAGRPHSVAVSADGKLVAVSSRDGDRVVVLDAATLAPRREVPTAAEPLGLALSADGRSLFAAEASADSVFCAGPAREPVRLAAGREPYALALSRDGRTLAVSNRMPRLSKTRDVPVSELTVIDARDCRVTERRDLPSADLSEGAAVAADGSFALAPVLRVRNLLPTTEVARGGLMNSALAYADLRPGGRTVEFPLDEPNAFFADPSGVALTPDGRTAFVAHGGADLVTAVDAAALRRLASALSPAQLDALQDDLGASARYVLGRIPTGANPRALALSPDGRTLYVSERLDDSVAVIDVRSLRLTGRISLGGPKALTAERRGDRRFHDGRATFQGQFSCRSCHPEGHVDGLTWDFEIDGLGKEIVDPISLRGIKGTEPFKWTGKNPTLQRQCGPRFSRVLMRTDPFPPDQLADLARYIESIPLPPRRLRDLPEDAVARGREVFFRARTNQGLEIAKKDRCSTCHPPPLYTDRLPFDVGTGGVFDTPRMPGLRYSAPYLHDDRAETLEEIWTLHNSSDTHGVTSDMNKAQLNDLITYLKSL